MFTYKHELSSMIFISEWSFAAAFLNGQGLVKFVIKIIEVSGKARKTPLLDRIAVFLTCFIVILFVPSLVILALVVLDNKQTVGLAIAQVILFIISAGIYVYLGYLLKQLESGRSLLKQIEFWRCCHVRAFWEYRSNDKTAQHRVQPTWGTRLVILAFVSAGSLSRFGGEFTLPPQAANANR